MFRLSSTRQSSSPREWDSASIAMTLVTISPPTHQDGKHRRRRSNFFCPLSGVVIVTAVDRTWTVPAHHGLWLPAHIEHDCRMVGVVEMQSLDFGPELSLTMPRDCKVVEMSSLAKSLMAEAARLPIEEKQKGRAAALMTLLKYEIEMMPALPLWLPLPGNETLSRHCRQFLLNPTAASHTKAWADALDTSRRTFTRLFRKETTLSLVEWRQRACILAALPELVAGKSVSETALCLGYENPASFTTLFRRVLGVPPKKYATSIIQNQPRRPFVSSKRGQSSS